MTGTLSPETVRPASLADPALSIGGRSLRSRLMVGTGKYRSNDDMVRAIKPEAKKTE